MIPELIPEALHYEGLIQVGHSTLSKCSRCHTWTECKLYREKYREGLQGHKRRVCDDCMKVEL